MRKIDEIIVHYSKSDVKSHDDISVIREWHKARKFKDVGYHYFIRKDGVVQKGRELKTTGAHCKGHNRNSIGICVSGTTKFTRFQFKALADLINRLKMGLMVDLEVNPHNKYDEDTECPGFNLERFKLNYL